MSGEHAKPVGEGVRVGGAIPLLGDQSGLAREPLRRFVRQAGAERAVNDDGEEQHEHADDADGAQQEALREPHASRGARSR